MTEIPGRTIEELEEILKEYDVTMDINKGRRENNSENDSAEAPKSSGPDDGDLLG